jgi:dihydrodipicolinate synthase/N-acetylneuraminate lyase
MGSSRALYKQTPERPLMARCIEPAQAGRLPEAYAVLADVKLLIDRIQMRYLSSGRHPIALVRHATELLGWAGGPVRSPIPAATAEDRRAAAETLAASGLLPEPSGRERVSR